MGIADLLRLVFGGHHQPPTEAERDEAKRLFARELAALSSRTRELNAVVDSVVPRRPPE